MISYLVQSHHNPNIDGIIFFLEEEYNNIENR